MTNKDNIDWSKFNPVFDFSFINIDCENCKNNIKLSDCIEDDICPICGSLLTIPIYYDDK